MNQATPSTRNNALGVVLSDDGKWIPPPLLNCEYRDIRDPNRVGQAYLHMGRIEDIVHTEPEGRCLHRVGHLRVNSMLITATTHTPFEARVRECSDVHLIVAIQGEFQLKDKSRSLRCSSGGAVLTGALSGTFEANGSGCAIRLKRSLIASAAAAIAGRPGMTRQERREFEQLKPIAMKPGAPANAIHGLIHYLDTCFAVGPLVAGRLGLDDVMHRLVAMLVKPDLFTEETTDRGSSRQSLGSDGFDELIDYIKANLDQPLRMSDLEARANYSRRALHYAFRERLGCAPKQWIREQRLALALEQLQADGERPLVRQVALACGYLQMSHFSADFKQRHGITPSQARRC